MLENLVKTDGNATPELLCEDKPSCLVAGVIAVLHELMAQELQGLQRPWCLIRQVH